MNREKLISREYKLVLKAERFAGKENDLLKKAAGFWAECSKAIESSLPAVNGKLDKITTRREIGFYDSKAFGLYSHSYIFRERRDLTNDETEVTLKFRHPDRYVSQDRDMLSRKIGKGDTKFEEDVKAPFVKLYSFSSTQPVKKDEGFTRLKSIMKLYPGLKPQLDKKADEEDISLVNGQSVRELVITGGDLILSGDPVMPAECALIVWYDAKDAAKGPLIVEFSFRYGNKKEKYSRE